MAEETGLRQVALLRRLGEVRDRHPYTATRQVTAYWAAVTDHPDSSWTHDVTGSGVDAGVRFVCRFESLPLHGSLAGGQGAFLDQIE